jgi:hypothetical protein
MAASKTNVERELEEKLKVVVNDGAAFGTEGGIVTGQKDQTFLPESAQRISTVTSRKL